MTHNLSELFSHPAGTAVIRGSYDAVTVVLSVTIAVFASYVALGFANRMSWGASRQRNLWLVLGAATMGVGIWSMHFVGMLAYQLPIKVRYDLWITLFSMVPAGVATWLAFYIVSRPRVGWLALASASLFMGLAISSMHYVGMSAMIMPAMMAYQPDVFAVSLLIAIAASFGALKLAQRFHHQQYPPEWQKQLAALMMGLAVSGMHYVGMAAMRVYDMCVTPPDYSGSFDLGEYDWLFALVTLLFLLVMVFQGIRDRFSESGMSLAAKTTLMTSVLVISVAGIVGLLAYNHTRNVAVGDEIKLIEQEVNEEVEELEALFEQLHEDIRYLQQHPVLATELEEAVNESIPFIEWGPRQERYHETALVMGELLRARPNYAQIRFVGLSERGRELIRIERRGETIVRIPDQDLQYKGDEPYFREVLASSHQDVYLSSVSLNREYGIVTLPHTLMLRAAKMVNRTNGELVGFLVINLDLTTVLGEMIVTESPNDADHITNQKGEILLARDARIPFSTEQAGDLSLIKYYPQLLDSFTENRREQAVRLENEQYVLSLKKLFFDPVDPGRFLAVSEVIPMAEIQRRIQPVLNRLFLMTLLLAVLAAWPVVLLVRMIVKPLNRITEATGQFASGGALPSLDLDRSDEIGALARAFSSMAGQVRAREQALSESEELTRKVIQNAGDGIVIIDEKGIIQSVNDAAIQIFGYSESEMEGSNVSMLMPDPYRTEHDGYMQRYLRSGNSEALRKLRELEGQRKGGDCFPLELVTTEVVHGSGRLFVGMLRDISQRKEIEQELRLAGRVMEASQESIIITDADQNICAINPAFTEITGYCADEVLGRKPNLLSSGRHDKAFYDHMWSQINTNGSWKGEIWDQRKNGQIYPKWMSVSAIKNDEGKVTHYVGVASDITERKLSEHRLEQLAHYDALTGLPNRMLLQDRLRHGINQCRRGDTRLALLFLDLDRFKSVNDNYGHEVGDQLLNNVADRLRSCVREGDTLARQGGDEFVVVVSDIHEPSDAGKVAEHLIVALQAPFYIDGKECFIGGSVGIAVYPDDGDDLDELARKADTAMYRAKESGGNRYSLYDQRMGEEASRRLQIENYLRYAVERNELELHFQPVISMQSGEVVAVESLMRWTHPELGQVSPAEFIPLAEDAGLISNIGRWGLAQACRQFRLWRDQGVKLERLAVNISPRCLLQPALPEYIEELLRENGIPPGCLELELTETTVMEYSGHAARFFEHIEKLGVRLAIDDFGTGYSSLAYIKQLPIHVLKIDRSFVRDIGQDPNDREIIRGVTALAHGLGLEVVAEGVEDLQQLEFLRTLGCDLVQGWLYLPAVPGDEITARLSKGMALRPGGS
jgi:diguanylate cyclase (GGDEF)-like protein/PAS domain S-box-containing protein